MRYVRPKSLTWWAGVFLILMGILQAAGVPEPWPGAEGVAGVLNAITGAVSSMLGGADTPAALIGLGMGLIGLRDALIRDQAQIEAQMGFDVGDAPYWGDNDDDDDDGMRDPWEDGGSRA